MAYESPVYATIELIRGDSYTPKFSVFKDDAAQDLSGFEVVWSLKASLKDADSDAVVVKRKSFGQVVIDDTDNHVCFLYLSPSETRALKPGIEYHWDLRIKSNDGSTVATPMKGVLRAQREGLQSL